MTVPPAAALTTREAICTKSSIVSLFKEWEIARSASTASALMDISDAGGTGAGEVEEDSS